MNFPIVDGILAGKVYAMYRHSDDYAENLVPGVSDLGGGEVTTFRGALRLTPSDNIDWYVSADYTHRDNSTAAGRNAAPATFVPCASFGFFVNQPQGPHELSLDFAGIGRASCRERGVQSVE